MLLINCQLKKTASWTDLFLWLEDLTTILSESNFTNHGALNDRQK